MYWFADMIFNGKLEDDPIRAYFKDGNSVEYTTRIWDLLVTDPDVECITSEETGEVLFHRD